MTRYALSLALLLATGTALGGGAVGVSGAYVRAVPPGAANSAAFMSLSNGSGEARALVGAESPASEVVELHTHSLDEGMMRMRRVERIEVPAGGAVTLEPGGLHLMLIGLQRQLEPGDAVGLTLIFDDDSRRELTVPVQPVMPGAGHQHHH